MIDIEADDGSRGPGLPDRKPDPLLVEKVRSLALAHGGLRPRRSLAARAPDALLSVLVTGIAVLYVGWALTFASRLYH